MKMSKIKVAGWVMTGVILALALSAIFLTKAEKITDDFWAVGEVYDFSQGISYGFECKGGYADSSKTWNITEDDFEKLVILNQKSDRYRYLVFNIENLKSPIQYFITYLNLELEQPILEQVYYMLEEGQGIIELPDLEFSEFTIGIREQQGLTFKMQYMQMRSNKPIDNAGIQLLKYFLIVLSSYILGSVILIKFMSHIRWKININWFVLRLQAIYCILGNKVFGFLQYLNKIRKSYLRITLFLILTLFFNATSNKILVGYTSIERTLFCSLILLMIALLCIEKKLQRQTWNNKLVKTWIIFIVFVIISDIVVKKTLALQGPVLLLIFGFLIFNWKSMDKQDILIKDFLNAMHIYFVLSTLFCFICRPDIGSRYMGTFSHPVTFSTYQALIVAVAIVEIDEYIRQGGGAKKIGFHIVELLVSIFFIWKTQTRSGLLAIVIVVLVWGIKNIITYETHQLRKGFYYICIYILVAFAPVVVISNFAITNIPHLLHSQVVFDDDRYKQEEQLKTEIQIPQSQKAVPTEEFGLKKVRTPLLPLVSIRTGGTETRIWQKFFEGSLEGRTSGRSTYWKAYFRQMNLFGHKNYAIVVGREQHPHSSLLLIAYRYGVFSVIPYILMLVLALKESIVNVIGNKVSRDKYAIFPLVINIVFLSVSLFDVAEYLYSGLIWVVFYWVMGFFFVNHEGD